MAKFRGNRIAFGKPGIEPRWTQGAKAGAGTAYATSSRLWFTLCNGIITETYYPTIVRPQIRDLQYLITYSKSFFHEEKGHLQTRMECPQPTRSFIASLIPILTGATRFRRKSLRTRTSRAFCNIQC
jgi:Glucodextranase, domain N